MNPFKLYLTIHVLLFIAVQTFAIAMPVWLITVTALGIWAACELAIMSLAGKQISFRCLVDANWGRYRMVFAVADRGAYA